MANHKSAIKRNRQNPIRFARNKADRTIVKTAIKNVLYEVDEGNIENAQKELKRAEQAIARKASKGVIHQKAASRKISGLAKKVHQLSASA